MSWLRRLLGWSDDPPPHVQAALDTAAEASDATDKAQAAVRSYWSAQRASARVRSDAVINEYERADEARTRAR